MYRRSLVFGLTGFLAGVLNTGQSHSGIMFHATTCATRIMGKSCLVEQSEAQRNMTEEKEFSKEVSVIGL